jgi:hypothetical protein
MCQPSDRPEVSGPLYEVVFDDTWRQDSTRFALYDPRGRLLANSTDRVEAAKAPRTAPEPHRTRGVRLHLGDTLRRKVGTWKGRTVVNKFAVVALGPHQLRLRGTDIEVTTDDTLTYVLDFYYSR